MRGQRRARDRAPTEKAKASDASRPAMGILDRRHKRAEGVKLRPNDPCLCGSGRPVKECCPQLLEA